MGAMPYPLTTERLTLRFIRPGDEDVLTAYRNDPAVAALQDWDLPYERAHAERLAAHQADLTDLERGGHHQIGIEVDGELAGDLYVGLHEQGGVAEIGFTRESLAPRSYWWRGQWDDNLTYALSDEQWRARRG